MFSRIRSFTGDRLTLSFAYLNNVRERAGCSNKMLTFDFIVAGFRALEKLTLREAD